MDDPPRRPGRRISGAALESMLAAHELFVKSEVAYRNPNVPPPIPMEGKRANVCGADVRGADFRNRNLLLANFGAADLRFCDFTGANLEEVEIGNADLRGAKGLTLKMIDEARLFLFIPPAYIYDQLVARDGAREVSTYYGPRLENPDEPVPDSAWEMMLRYDPALDHYDREPALPQAKRRKELIKGTACG